MTAGQNASHGAQVPEDGAQPAATAPEGLPAATEPAPTATRRRAPRPPAHRQSPRRAKPKKPPTKVYGPPRVERRARVLVTLGSDDEPCDFYVKGNGEWNLPVVTIEAMVPTLAEIHQRRNTSITSVRLRVRVQQLRDAVAAYDRWLQEVGDWREGQGLPRYPEIPPADALGTA